MTPTSRPLTLDAATARAIELRKKHHDSYQHISDYMLRRHGIRLTADEWRQRCGGRPLKRLAPKPETIRFPTPPQAFTRAYQRALAAGIDLLEERDAINECKHGRLPGYPCGCWGPVQQEPKKKAREAA